MAYNEEKLARLKHLKQLAQKAKAESDAVAARVKALEDVGAQANVLETDAAKRATVYGELQREHQKVSPFVIMFQQIEVSAQRKGVDNWVIGPSSDTNFYAPITKN